MNKACGLLIVIFGFYASSCQDSSAGLDVSEPYKISSGEAIDANPYKNLEGVKALYLEANREKDPVTRLAIMQRISDITRHDVVVAGDTYVYVGPDSVKRELCYAKIKQAYERKAIGSTFALDDKLSCQRLIWEYDIKYRNLAD